MAEHLAATHEVSIEGEGAKYIWIWAGKLLDRGDGDRGAGDWGQINEGWYIYE